MCASVLERKNLIASPFTSSLKMPLGWEEEKCRYWKVFFLSVCSYPGGRLCILRPRPRRWCSGISSTTFFLASRTRRCFEKIFTTFFYTRRSRHTTAESAKPRKASNNVTISMTRPPPPPPPPPRVAAGGEVVGI